MTLTWMMEVGPKPSDWCSCKGQEKMQPGKRRGHVTTEAENGVTRLPAQNATGHHPWRLGDRPAADLAMSATKRNQLCCHPDFRTMRE